MVRRKPHHVFSLQFSSSTTEIWKLWKSIVPRQRGCCRNISFTRKKKNRNQKRIVNSDAVYYGPVLILLLLLAFGIRPMTCCVFPTSDINQPTIIHLRWQTSRKEDIVVRVVCRCIILLLIDFRQAILRNCNCIVATL